MDWLAFGAQVAVLVGGLPILRWLTERYVAHRLSMSLESHKHTMAREVSEAVEAIKRENSAQLQIEKAKLDHVASRWSHRYGKFHEHRVNAIIDLHDAVVDMRLALAPVFGLRPAGSPPVREDAMKAGEKYNHLHRLFAHKRLFINDELAEQHDQLLNTYLDLISGFTSVPENEMWRDAPGKWYKFTGDAQGLERAIRREYQRSLGSLDESADFSGDHQAEAGHDRPGPSSGTPSGSSSITSR